jgi:hypothetical protein
VLMAIGSAASRAPAHWRSRRRDLLMAIGSAASRAPARWRSRRRDLLTVMEHSRA